MVSTAMSDAKTVVAGRYETLETLGRGAMGIVYRARDRELDRIVAIKTIDGRCATDASGAVAARLQQEATAAARLSHPGIVTIHDVGVAGGVPYIVMEYFRGRTLSALVARGPLPPAKAVLIGVQVCRALQYAHGEGVVHRDVKSSNIMVDDAWRVKLTDFGVARVVGRGDGDPMIVGTPAYIAPEHAQGRDADARSDLYALGVVLYEALTGERPFPSTDFATVLHEVVHLDPVPPRERNFAVSPALDAVVRRIMSKDPDDRYPDATTFGDALDQALADGPGPIARAWGVVGRQGAAAVLVVAIAATAVGAAAWRAAVETVELVTPSASTVRSLSTSGLEPGAPSAMPPAQPAVAPSTQPAETVATPTPATMPTPPAALAPTPLNATAQPTSAVATTPSPAMAPMPPPVTPAPPPTRTPAPTAAGRVARPRVAPALVVARRSVLASEAEPAAAPAVERPANQKTGCLSVNATPFATVYVDDRAVGTTPHACLRVSTGRHRLVFESMDERSPEEIVVVGDQHTAEAPLSVSYDFRARRFVAR
jgi:serine/threonine-protein kinase